MRTSKRFYISNWLVMAISIPERAWQTSQLIQDESKRLRFLEAIIMYKLDWTMPSDEDIAPLIVATLWNVERNKKISQTMKWNSNAKKVKTVKTDKNRWKQIETDWNSSKQITELTVLERKCDAENISSELVEIDKTDETDKNSSVLYINNNISKEINNLILELKETSNNLWIVYDKKNERNFCKHILTAKEFWDAADKALMTRVEFAKNIMVASVMINYWKWACAWPMAIYQNYSDVYNKAVQEKSKQMKNKIYSF